jgi:hypothetical protein
MVCSFLLTLEEEVKESQISFTSQAKTSLRNLSHFQRNTATSTGKKEYKLLPGNKVDQKL